MDQAWRANQWIRICQSAKAQTAIMVKGRSPPANDLIIGELKKFSEQPEPETDAELPIRRRQAVSLTTRISAITHADWMAQFYPSVGFQILELTRKYCEQPWPRSEDELWNLLSQTSMLIVTIGSLCSGVPMRKS